MMTWWTITTSGACAITAVLEVLAVLEAVSSPPPANLYHALHWYSHIKSFKKERACLPRTPKEDDDELALSGSEEEEESEEDKRLRGACLAQCEPKKVGDRYGKLECMRSIRVDSLGGASGYGIKAPHVRCVAEDSKVGTDGLEEQVPAFELSVQLTTRLFQQNLNITDQGPYR
ncbi:Elongation factor 1-beta, partial [Galemys pyrenaicus]